MTKNNKKYFLFIILSISLIVFSIFILRNLFFDIRKTSNQYLEEKKELKAIAAHEKDLRNESREEIRNKLKAVNKLFINPERPIKKILLLEEIAEKNNFPVNIQIGEKINNSDLWPYLEFNIEFTGSFVDLASFLEEIKKEKWIYSINNLSIEAEKQRQEQQQEEERGNISGNLSIRAYFLNNTYEFKE